MPTIAELTIKVNTTDLDRAKKSLDDIAKAAPSVENATSGVTQGFNQSAKAADSSTSAQERLIAKAEKMVATFGKGKGEVLKYDAALKGVSSVVDPLANRLTELTKAQKEQADVTKAVQKSQEQLGSAQYKMIEALREEIALFGKSKEEILLYRAGLMGISDQVAPLVAELNRLKEAKQAEAQAGKEGVADRLTKRQAEKAALAEEAVQLERLIALKRQEAQAERAAATSSGTSGVTGTREAEAALERYTQKLEDTRVKQAAVAAEIGKLDNEFMQLKYSIDPTSKSLDDLALKQSELNRIYRSGMLDIPEQEFNNLNGLLDQQRQKLLGIGTAVDGVGDEFGKLRAQIDPAAAALEKVNVQQAKLNALYNNGKGSLPTAEYQRLNTILDQNRKRIADLGTSTGKTAKEINFAMRGLPAQFTDIFVSLQGGQAPLTVFLQQGGQIKDMFGGVGPAFRAMGGYILGLINPLTVGAAALTALAVAMYQAREETSAFNKATIQGAGFSGASAQALASYRNELDGIAGTAGQAAKALSLLQASGKVSSTVFVQISEAAIKMQRATGTAIADTIEEFSSLAKDPVNAAAALDEKYRFLTATTISYAQSLVQQGETQKATIFLQQELAKAVTETADSMIEKGGFVERAWRNVKDVITETWDAIKDIGRETPLDDQISDLKKEIADIKSGKGFLGFLGANTALRQFRLNILQARKAREDEAAAKRQQEEVDRRAAAAIALQNAQNYASNIAAIDAVKAAELDLKKVRDNGAKLQAIAIRERRTLTQEELKFQKAAEAAAEKRLNDAIKSQNKRDERDNKPDVVRQTAADKLLSTILQQGAALKNQLETQGKVLAEEDKLAKLKERIRIAEQAAAQGRATVDQKSIIASKDILLAEQQKNVELQKGIAAEQERVRLKNLQASIDARIASNQQKYDDRLVGVGLGDKEKERLRERLELQKNYDRELARLTKQRNERGNAGQGEFESGTAKLQAELTANQKALEENYAKMDAAQANWENGASAAWSNYLAEGKNVAGMTQSFFTSAFSSMEDALVGFVTTGKLSFKDLTISILNDLAKMATKIAANQILMGIFGAFSGGISGGLSSSATINTGSSFAGYAAKGRAYDSGVQFFAKGGTFTNSVVSTPTAFGTGSGLGIMGEAGPEAIMPLTRTSDGQLGVKAAGGGGSTVVAPVSVTVNVSDSGAGSNSPSNNTEQQGRAVQMAIKSEVEKTIQIGLQPGGVIWRSLNNR